MKIRLAEQHIPYDDLLNQFDAPTVNTRLIYP
jgi:hypothetical protein